MAKKPKGFRAFDKLARKLAQVPKEELRPPIMLPPRACIDCGKPSGNELRCLKCDWKRAGN